LDIRQGKEKPMRDLIVVGFHGKHRAAEVLDQLRRLDADQAIHLQDGVAAYRRDNGKLRIETSLHRTGKQGAAFGVAVGATVGGMLGLVLGGVLVAPFTAAASTAVAMLAMGVGAAMAGGLGAMMGAQHAVDWKVRLGITDDFVKQVGGRIRPGDSAVFALIDARHPMGLASHFAGYGGTILHTTLSADVAAEVQATIRG
jgi:uncharacterized membrane protein